MKENRSTLEIAVFAVAVDAVAASLAVGGGSLPLRLAPDFFVPACESDAGREDHDECDRPWENETALPPTTVDLIGRMRLE